MKPLVVVIFFCLFPLLPACTHTPIAGRVFFFELPPQCSPLALAEIQLPVITVDRLPYAPGSHAYGLWKQYPNGDRVILLRRDAPRDVLSHELCHEVMFRLTGSPAWHPSNPQ